MGGNTGLFDRADDQQVGAQLGHFLDRSAGSRQAIQFGILFGPVLAVKDGEFARLGQAAGQALDEGVAEAGLPCSDETAPRRRAGGRLARSGRIWKQSHRR